jgi:hypothetical protein
MAGSRARQGRIGKALRVAGGTVFAVFWLVFCAWTELGNPFEDSSVTVPAPDPADRRAAVAELQRAMEAHGVCYGWTLGDSSTRVSTGSSLGDGARVDSDLHKCKNWVEVHVAVNYTDESSELEDSAVVAIYTSSPDWVLYPESLEKLGLDEQAFLDDPGDAVLRAALALPMLAASTGLVPGLPPPTPAAAANRPADPPTGGSDFWRDRWPLVAASGGLLAVAIAGFGLGWWQRRQDRAYQRRHAAAAQPGNST